MQDELLNESSRSGAVDTSNNFSIWPLRRLNHNVALTFIVAAFEGAGDSVWNGSVLAAFIYELMGASNSYVGYVEAAQGTIILLVGLPMGWIADKFAKPPVIIAGALCIPIAVAATAFAAVYGVAHEGIRTEELKAYWVLFGAMCAWGVAYAVYGGALQAMMADSIPTRSRVWSYTKLSQVSLLASALGPIIAIVIFALHGDKWAKLDMRNVLCVGVAIELPMFIPMLFFRTSCTVDEESTAASTEATADVEGAAATHGTSTHAPVTAAEDALPPVTPPRNYPAAGGGGDAGTGEAPGEAPPSAHATKAGTNDEASELSCVWVVPYVLFLSEIFFALGSGMTVKFFPLFFKNDLRLSPVAVQVIYLVLPLMMAACNGLGEVSARRVGRLPVCIGFKLVGLSLLVTMALIKEWVAPPMPTTNATDYAAAFVHAADAGAFAPAVRIFDDGALADGRSASASFDYVRLLKALLMIVIYLFRTTLMNSTYALSHGAPPFPLPVHLAYPMALYRAFATARALLDGRYALEEGILMDFVPAKSRARWKALSSISTFGWTGSALVGGVMVDATDYSTTFLITAALQAAGTLTMALLICVIPRHLDFEKDDDEEEGAGGREQNAASDTSAGRTVEPLLAGNIQGGRPEPVFPNGSPTFREESFQEAD